MMRQFHPIEMCRNDAALILPLVLGDAKSVLDLGCNNGQWLAECLRLGVVDVLGVDGGGMVEAELLVPVHKFVEHDLTTEFDAGRKFDLVLCIEVAEHLPDSAAKTLVDTVVRHGDRILFSAAVPGQGGYQHVNERPHSYWREMFRDCGYETNTAIRAELSDGVSWWLKNNLCVVRKCR